MGFLRRLKTKKPNREAGLFAETFGAEKRSRTPDLRITNALLYQLSYPGNEETKL